MTLKKFCYFLAATSLYFSGVNLGVANDSSYFGSGNQIIPLQETDISVKKEVLTIKRIKGNKVRITVDYIFHNPAKEKSLLMGFEAQGPYTEGDTSPRNGEHPYIENFSVIFNGKNVPHKVSFLTEKFQDDGKNKLPYTLENLKKYQIKPDVGNEKVDGDFYVYQFPATFAPGDTRVIHTYDYRISGAVYTYTSIEYLLSPALRWANQQIDDFTLIIDLGELQQYHIYPKFFSDLSQWTTQGRVKIAMEDVKEEMSGDTERMMTVWQHQGSVTFHAKNFRPKGELVLFANRNLLPSDESIDAKKMKISLQGLPWFGEMKLKDEFARKVLENFPYARRGYVFQNQKLKAFYEAHPWYMPDPEYKPVPLTDDEKDWLKEVSALEIESE